jgi:hypothetical protein
VDSLVFAVDVVVVALVVVDLIIAVVILVDLLRFW